MSRLSKTTVLLLATALVWIVCLSLFALFVGPGSHHFLAPTPAKILLWVGITAAVLFYCALVVFSVRKIAETYSSLVAGLSTILILGVSIPVALFALVAWVVAFESIPQPVRQYEGHQVYVVGENPWRDYPIYLVDSGNWLWLNEDPSLSMTELESSPYSSPSSSDPSTLPSELGPSQAAPSLDPTVQKTLIPRADGAIEVENTDYIERIGNTSMGFDTSEKRYPIAVVQENGTWYAYPDKAMPGELYSSFYLHNGVAVASFGTSNGSKNFVTTDGGKTWKRFLTPDVNPAEDIEQGEIGAFIWDAREKDGTYFILLNYPSWSMSTEEGQWYSSTDGVNWHKAAAAIAQ